MNFQKWLLAVLILLYVVLPVDFIPDIIPLLGWIDDLIFIIGFVYWVVKK